jgi:ABC-type Fe3+ transport system substrate-binding protein
MILAVLASAKGPEVQKKGKGAADAKWDAEVRKSLANKKAGPATLTKQQQALVQAQLEKEAQVRQWVEGIKAHLERGLRLVGSVVDAKVDELKLYVSVIQNMLVSGALGKGPLLVGHRAFEAYLVCLVL